MSEGAFRSQGEKPGLGGQAGMSLGALTRGTHSGTNVWQQKTVWDGVFEFSRNAFWTVLCPRRIFTPEPILPPLALPLTSAHESRKLEA
jgi:hypothetical protein